jgi:hypothetical protein
METSDYVVGPSILELLTEPNSDLLVIQGTVTAVDRGIGMSWTFDDDAEQRHLTDFNDPQAVVRSVHVTMTIDRLLAGSDDATDVRFGLIIDEPEQHDTLADGLTGEPFVAFLTRSELWDYENDLYGVMVDGTLLCRPEDEGLDCPALDEGLAAALELDAAAETLLDASGRLESDPALPFENPELAGLCEDLINDFAEGEPSPAATEEEAADLLVTENSILRGLEVRDGKVFHLGQQVGSYQVVERPGDTFAVESAEWCFPGE